MSARQSSAVDRALRHIARGMTAYAAARREKIALSTIYRAVKRHKPVNPPALP
jgi:transposase